MTAGLTALASCGPGRAVAPPEESLALPSDTLTAGWGNLPSAAPLGPGRWAVISSDFDAAVIADFNSKSITPLGGAKQTAYLHPSFLFTVGDTMYLDDWGKRRTTVWTGDGRLIDSIPSPDALRGSLPRARDAAGQLYFEVTPLPGRDGGGNRDSASIVRAPRALSQFDTVVRLSPLDLKEVDRENNRRFEPMVFSGKDLWGVWPDGTIWIARLLRNQIVTRDASGKVTRGPELPDPVYEVTQADRERYLQGFPADVRPKETDLPWALIHPPFVSAIVQPGTAIWLEKSKPALDSVRRIHVVDRQGNLQRVFRLTGAARLIAAGSDRLLVAEQFAGGVRLMQVRIPARIALRPHRRLPLPLHPGAYRPPERAAGRAPALPAPRRTTAG
jgi:hypothetical protein